MNLIIHLTIVKKTIEFEPDKFRIEHLYDNIPMVFSIKATKKIDS